MSQTIKNSGCDRVMERYWGEKKSTKSQDLPNDIKITVQDNKIYYYSNVNRGSCELNKKIGELEGKYLGTKKFRY